MYIHTLGANKQCNLGWREFYFPSTAHNAREGITLSIPSPSLAITWRPRGPHALPPIPRYCTSHTTNQSDAISHWCLLFLGSPPANIYSLQVAERKPAANCVEQPFVDSCPRSDWILDIDTGHTSSGLSLLSTWLLSVYCKE